MSVNCRLVSRISLLTVELEQFNRQSTSRTNHLLLYTLKTASLCRSGLGFLETPEDNSPWTSEAHSPSLSIWTLQVHKLPTHSTVSVCGHRGGTNCCVSSKLQTLNPQVVLWWATKSVYFTKCIQKQFKAVNRRKTSLHCSPSSTASAIVFQQRFFTGVMNHSDSRNVSEHHARWICMELEWVQWVDHFQT